MNKKLALLILLTLIAVLMTAACIKKDGVTTPTPHPVICEPYHKSPDTLVYCWTRVTNEDGLSMIRSLGVFRAGEAPTWYYPEGAVTGVPSSTPTQERPCGPLEALQGGCSK